MCNPCPKSDERIVTVPKDHQVMIRRASLKDLSRIANVNNLYFKDSHLSKLHASIKLENGKLYLMDCHSTFGTILNFDYLLPGQWHEIKNGDLIGFIISRPSASIYEVVDSWTEPSNKIPLSHFQNPSIGLQFKVSVIDNIIKFLPIRLLKYASLNPTTNEENITNEDTTKNENDDLLIDSNENSTTQIIDSSMAYTVASPIRTVTPKTTPIITSTFNTPKPSTPVEPKSTESTKSIASVELNSVETPEISSTKLSINEVSKGQEVNNTFGNNTHKSESSNNESNSEIADNVNFVKKCIFDMDFTDKDGYSRVDEELLIDESKLQSEDLSDDFDSNSDSESDDSIDSFSSDSSNDSRLSFSSDSQSTNEESEVSDISDSVSVSENEISHSDVFDTNKLVPISSNPCFELNDILNPRKRNFESDDLDDDEDYCDEEIELRHRRKKPRSEERFKHIAKEVGKALVYILGTITALGVYGSSLDKNQ
jgi:hypothetical protein